MEEVHNIRNTSTIAGNEDVEEALSYLDKIHPGFAKSYRDFYCFLKLTCEDLQGKAVSIETQSRLLRNRRKLRNYLNCQHFMLQKHLHRLHKFNQEINDRVIAQGNTLEEIPSSPVPSGDLQTSYKICTPDELKNIEDDFKEAAIDCVGLEASRPSTSSGRSLSEQSLDTSFSTDLTIHEVGRENPIRQLERDMAKMKRRCKHILDVTDKYCVLNSETDLHLKIDDFNNSLVEQGKSPPLSPWTNKSPTIDEIDGINIQDGSRGDGGTPQKLPSAIDSNGAVKLTVESFCNHLLVIFKTYTKKHSKTAPSAAYTVSN